RSLPVGALDLGVAGVGVELGETGAGAVEGVDDALDVLALHVERRHVGPYPAVEEFGLGANLEVGDGLRIHREGERRRYFPGVQAAGHGGAAVLGDRKSVV